MTTCSRILATTSNHPPIIDQKSKILEAERSFPWRPCRFCVENVPVLSDLSQQAFKEKRQRKTRYWDVDSDGEEVGVTEGIRRGWKHAAMTWTWCWMGLKICFLSIYICCTYIRRYVRTYRQTYIHTFLIFLHIHVYIYIFIYTHIHIYTCNSTG